jgi:hypothetical protein
MKIKILVLVMLCMHSFAAKKAAKESMELVPTYWAAFMRGDVMVNGSKVGINRDTWDYYSDLAPGGSLELALRNSSMVVLGYVDYLDGISSDVSSGSQSGTLKTTEIVGCLAVGYPFAPPGGKTTFDALVGLQGVRMENELKLNGSSPESSSTDVYDPVVMFRIKTQLGNKLYINIPLSFGVSFLGDSEMVYDAGLQLMYQFTKTFDVRAGYRISGSDYQEDANNKWDSYVQGYTLGLGMTF